MNICAIFEVCASYKHLWYKSATTPSRKPLYVILKTTDMNEIEIKVRFDNLEQIVEKFKEIGCVFSEPKRQEDIIFLDAKMTEYKIVEGTIVLRIRNENGKYTFTIKQQLGRDLSSKEYEVEISNATSMYAMLQLMGFKELVRVNKTRLKGKYKSYNLCIDNVERLGNFLEIECLTERTDYEVVQNEMLTFLKEIGIDTIQQVTVPYDTQIYYLNNPKNS
jgi:adenylate cyclase class 2